MFLEFAAPKGENTIIGRNQADLTPRAWKIMRRVLHSGRANYHAADDCVTSHLSELLLSVASASLRRPDRKLDGDSNLSPWTALLSIPYPRADYYRVREWHLRAILGNGAAT